MYIRTNRYKQNTCLVEQRYQPDLIHSLKTLGRH